MQVSRHERTTGQRSMFDDLAGSAADPVVQEDEFGRADLLAFEKELLGLYITAHPLDEYAELLAAYCLPLRQLADLSEGHSALVGGRIQAVRRVDTRRGGQMAFVTLEDGATQIEATAFPRTLESRRISPLCGRAHRQHTFRSGERNGELSVSLDEVFPLAEVAAHSARMPVAAPRQRATGCGDS